MAKDRLSSENLNPTILLGAQNTKNLSAMNLAECSQEDFQKHMFYMNKIIEETVPKDRQKDLLHAISQTMVAYALIAMNNYKIAVKKVHDADMDAASRAKKEFEKEISRQLAADSRHNDRGQVIDMPGLLKRVNEHRAKQDKPLGPIDIRTLRRHLGGK